MAEYKLNIGEPSGKTHKKVLDDEGAKSLMGKKLGDKVHGEPLGMPGYEFEITGGSDFTGTPMRPDVAGAVRKRILITGGIGFRNKVRGKRNRRMVAGNTIHPKTAQINLKVLKAGKEPLAPVAEKAEGEAKAE